MRQHLKAIASTVFVMAAGCAGLAESRECAGVAFPDQVQVDGTTLTLNGVSLSVNRTVF